MKKLSKVYKAYNDMILEQEVNNDDTNLIQNYQTTLALNNQSFTLHFLEHLIKTQKLDQLDQFFKSILPMSVSLAIWSLYVDHIFYNIENDPERLIQSLDYVVSMIGPHINSLDIWEAYLESVIEYSNTLSNREQHAKITSKIRSLFNAALSAPISGYDIILNSYRKWEETNSSELAENLVPIIEQKSKLTKLNYKKRLNHFTICCTNKQVTFPNEDDAEEDVNNWNTFINSEKSNPENLNKNVLYERVNFTYKLCINHMNHFVEFYVDYVKWLVSERTSENEEQTEGMIKLILNNCLSNNFYSSDSIISVYNLMSEFGLNQGTFDSPLAFLKANIIIDTDPILNTESSKTFKGKVFSLLLENIFYENNTVDHVRDFYFKIFDTIKNDFRIKVKLLSSAILFEFKIGNDKPTALKLLKYIYFEIEKERLGNKNPDLINGTIEKFNEFNEKIRSNYLSIREQKEIDELYSLKDTNNHSNKKQKAKNDSLQIYNKNIPVIFSSNYIEPERHAKECTEEGEIIAEEKVEVKKEEWTLGEISLNTTEYPEAHYQHISKFLTLSKYLKTRKNNFQGISVNSNILAELFSQMNPNTIEKEVVKRTSAENSEKEANELDKLLYNEKESFFINRILNKYK
eukprot:GAHX01001307.1.p1 GENE.GAHX01001307.1~~GAHX01001307.1.p1  ORF type:complete len:645 (-),score=133.01 GAHX01001307.1:153-2048(-)